MDSDLKKGKLYLYCITGINILVICMAFAGVYTALVSILSMVYLYRVYNGKGKGMILYIVKFIISVLSFFFLRFVMLLVSSSFRGSFSDMILPFDIAFGIYCFIEVFIIIMLAKSKALNAYIETLRER